MQQFILHLHQDSSSGKMWENNISIVRKLDVHLRRLNIFFEKIKNFSDYRWSYAILFLLLIIIEFFRRPGALLNAQPWAEDGAIFIHQAIYIPISSFFTPYAGYYHLIPRLVTFIALQFGLKNAPLIMNICALLISAFCISYIFRPQFRFLIPNDSHRFFLAILIACIPIIEIFLNIANILWFLLVFLTLWATNLIFNPEIPSLSVYNFFEMIFVIVSFLSCPLSIILIPGLFIGIFLKIKAKKVKINLLLYLIPIISLLIYSLMCFFVDKSHTLYIPSMTSVINLIASKIFIRFFYNDIQNYIYGYKYLVSFFIMILLGYSIINRRQYSIDLWIILLFILNFCVIIFFRPAFMYTPAYWNSGGTRHFFYPMVLVLILIFRHIITFDSSKIKYVFYILLIFFLINSSLFFQIPAFQDYNYRVSVQGFDRQGTESYHIPINPPGWYMKIPTNSTFLQENINMGNIHLQNSRYEWGNDIPKQKQ